MKKIALFAAACLLSAPIHAKTIATVNGEPITEQQLNEFVTLLTTQGAQDSPQLREQVRQEMINRAIIVQAAEKAGISKQADVRQELELARQGILVRALMADYLKKNPVSEADIKQEYEKIKQDQAGTMEYKLRHILVEDEAKAAELLERIKSKAVSFADAAKSDSIDSGSGQNGGDLGWSTTSNYVPEFAQAVAAMKKGELSTAPVKSEFGWHIIEVEDARPVTFPNLDEVKPQLEEMLRQDKLAQYQENLLQSAKIDIK